ncbi:succinyl-diaminopimelate desuccinylase [Gammaproteobacteria bacterium]|nr:succinyl-diaminopimelate desuccinylase [Gammaproteobacteria bacterium]
MHDRSLELSKELIARPSVTPKDEGCQQLIVDRLSPSGFSAEFMRFGEVDNLWLRRGEDAPLFVFLGHTDVVPAGPAQDWGSDPFVPTVRDGFLYGRGAADMKSSIAAFVTAATDFVADYPDHRGSIALLLTSDEEGPAIDGTRRVIDALSARGDRIDYCLVGEPTSESRLGDTIKIGRRGSLNGVLNIRGIQGHVAYPHLALNPVHRLAPALAELVHSEWDAGNPNFPSTSFQVTGISSGGIADNVIPGSASVTFNFRYSTASTAESLMQKVEQVLARHGMAVDRDAELVWTISGLPFLTQSDELTGFVSRAISAVLGLDTTPSTTGGTSDGRFIAPTGTQIVELGPVNKTIHKIDECVALDAPGRLSAVYYRILFSILTG